MPAPLRSAVMASTRSRRSFRSQCLKSARKVTHAKPVARLLVVDVGDELGQRNLWRLKTPERPRSTAAARRQRSRGVLADVLESAIAGDLDLRDRPGHAGCELGR
jgi:hypothetical protein